MAILAVVFYFVLTKDLRIPHQKALTRCVLLAVVAALVHFFLKRLRLEGFKEGADDSNKCHSNTKKKPCQDVSGCDWGCYRTKTSSS